MILSLLSTIGAIILGLIVAEVVCSLMFDNDQPKEEDDAD